jgi:hypothetical protein
VSSVNRDTPGGVVAFRRQTFVWVVSLTHQAALLYHTFCILSSILVKLFFEKFLKKLLTFSYLFGIIKLQKMKEGNDKNEKSFYKYN